MSDWFGEAPVEIQALSSSEHTNWQHFCSFCGSPSIVKFENKYLCIKHAEEVMLEWAE